MSSPAFKVPPPAVTIFTLEFPSPGVLLATINREQRMNAVPMLGHQEGATIWNWLDNEPSMRVGVITGKGSKIFCAGADLLEQRDVNASGDGPRGIGEGGFAGLSQRRGKKPVIAAVNGLALGGGFEICLNCDMVVASPKAMFALPEVLRGLYAGAGGLARLVRNCGMQIGTELALTGRRITAQEAQRLNLINRISDTHESVLNEALNLAQQISNNSPDAIIVSREGVREAWESGSVEQASRLTAERFSRPLMRSENIRIGLEAFAAKKQPQWVDSKL
ncbi:hypothetical protein BDW75DRAFT_246086 [Aspergillus navahoensis]